MCWSSTNGHHRQQFIEMQLVLTMMQLTDQLRAQRHFYILWFCQYTHELRALRHFHHTVDLSVYLRVTCTTSLLTYCGIEM
jgi:hypothetical protein